MSNDIAGCCGRKIHHWGEADQDVCDECLIMDIKDYSRRLHDVSRLLRAVEMDPRISELPERTKDQFYKAIDIAEQDDD